MDQSVLMLGDIDRSEAIAWALNCRFTGSEFVSPASTLYKTQKPLKDFQLVGCVSVRVELGPTRMDNVIIVFVLGYQESDGQVRLSSSFGGYAKQQKAIDWVIAKHGQDVWWPSATPIEKAIEHIVEVIGDLKRYT